MPVLTTYPGVYIEEIPSGVRTITGVATSITAFIGRAERGPVNEPFTITSISDFEREFGGLGVPYPMSYAVRDFYLNGGSTALIVRLYVSGDDDGVGRLAVDDLKLAAASPGVWGKKLRVAIDTDVSNEVRSRLGLGATDFLFNLTIREARPGGATERIRNLAIADKSSRRIDRVLLAESNLVQWDGNVFTPPALPKLKSAVDAQTALDTALAAKPQVPTTVDKAKEHLKAAQRELADPASKAEGDLATAQASKDPAKIKSAEDALTAAEDAMKGSPGTGLEEANYKGSRNDKSGFFALEKADLFNLLCILPDSREGDVPPAVYQDAMAYCQERRAMLIVDPPADWSSNKNTAAAKARDQLPTLGLTGPAARNAALYFPRAVQTDPMRESQLDVFVPCGLVAGIMARTDTTRGVWKAPAGLDAAINGIQALEVNLSDGENGLLNPIGINCLRSFGVAGRVVWGARTLRGADQLADEYKYVPVRRTALFLEESLYRGTQWVVFEPNDEPLWGQIRLNIGAFLNGLFRQGAFQGTTPREAYFVKCDKETTTQNDINLGVVNIVVGFAPLKPAEFVVIKLQQIAGQIQT
ncbi:MAG: phage tail sheath subtilisin-like domain-containing protein [Chthoniobacterales bacterium]|nr:phage tail sheath subtilisin-like domain-containing protein [Chthoniobacterales bacterium]